MGVTRYHFDKERHLLSSSFAKRAQYADEKWQLSDVTTTYFRDIGKGAASTTEVINVPTEQWDISLKPELLNTVVMIPESLPISGLWGYIHYLKDQGLNNGRYWLAF